MLESPHYSPPQVTKSGPSREAQNRENPFAFKSPAAFFSGTSGKRVSVRGRLLDVALLLRKMLWVSYELKKILVMGPKNSSSGIEVSRIAFLSALCMYFEN